MAAVVIVIGATGQVLVHVNSLGMAGQDSLKNEVFFFIHEWVRLNFNTISNL